MRWDEEIVRRLEKRNREEFHRHREMFEACEAALSARGRPDQSGDRTACTGRRRSPIRGACD